MSNTAEDGPEQPSQSSAESLIKGRYRVVRELGRGAQGIVWLADDQQGDKQVALKILSINKVEEWKAVELFEREGKALAALDHPAIPAYIDSFHLEDAQGIRMVLVQEYVQGEDLSEWIKGGRRLEEARVLEIALELLSILDHIHGLSPPIIHRDIKPSNIVIRPDGTVTLVDFGAAALTLPTELGGSTVAGTSGFMPMEQLMGQAQPSSDLFAMGATLVHLLSHKHPSTLPMAKMRLQFRPVVNVSEGFCDFLEALLEPHVEDRVASASEARALLLRMTAEQPEPAPKPEPEPAPIVPVEQAPVAPLEFRVDSPVALAKPAGSDLECIWTLKTAPSKDGSETEPPRYTLRVGGSERSLSYQSSRGFGSLLAVAGGLGVMFSVTNGFGFVPLLFFSALAVVGLLWALNGRRSAYRQLVWSPEGLVLSRPGFGGEQTREFEHDEILGVEMTGRDASGAANHYGVAVRSRFGKHKIAGARSLPEAQWLHAQVKAQFKKSRSY